MQCSVLELEGSKPKQKKVKLSLDPKEVNSGLSKSSLKEGMVGKNLLTIYLIMCQLTEPDLFLGTDFYLFKGGGKGDEKS